MARGPPNPAGQPDDATLALSFARLPRANYYQTKNGRTVWVKETPDAGTPAYQSQVVGTFSGDRVPRYSSRKPAGSIADVVAKGIWKDGFSLWSHVLAREPSRIPSAYVNRGTLHLERGEYELAIADLDQ